MTSERAAAIGGASLLIALVCATPIRAQAVQLEDFHVSTAHGAQAVCLRGDRLLVGVPDERVVHIFGAGDPPVPMGMLGRSASRFGTAVALSGDLVVVGAPATTGPGKAFVFAWDGTTWVEEASLEAPDAQQEEDFFGMTVDVSGETVVVGASRRDVGGNHWEGSAYVYERAAGVWTLVQTLATTDHDAGERFGQSVAIDGDRLAVGSLFGDGGSGPGRDGNGSVHVFVRDAGAWTLEQRLTSPVPLITFGNTVDLQGDLLAVGHPYGSSHGYVHLFRRTAGTWGLEASAEPLHGYSRGGQYGRSLELSGDRLIVGAIWYEPWGGFSGGAYVLERAQGGASWGQTRILVPSISTGHFGWGVTLDGERAVVAASSGGYGIYGYEILEGVGGGFCFGDGSGTPCPCDNASVVGAEAGCSNDGTPEHAAALAALREGPDVDGLVFSLLGTGPGHPLVVLFSGTASTGTGTPFGDGLLCTGGALRRHGHRTAASDYGIATWGPGITGLGGWQPGSTRRFQALYRRTNGGCSSGFNVSNGVEIAGP